MKLRVIKLGTECRELASGLKGTVTHWTCNMGQEISYFFQPRGLDSKNQPLKRFFLCLERLRVQESDFEEVEVPIEILGTTVTDKASGFTGMAVDFIRHINGCFHVFIQPRGLISGDGTPVDVMDFDLRGCTGKMIEQLSEQAKKESQKKNPSPTGGRWTRAQPASSPRPPRRR